MKKNLLIMFLALVISTTGTKTASAIYCANCATWFTQIPQYAQDIITAGASLGTQQQSILLTLWNTVRTPMENALITMAQQQMAGNIINWGNGGFQGNSLIIS